MIAQDLPQRIEELLQPILEESALELVELNIKRKGRTILIEVLTDRGQGGITLDNCTTVNRKIAREIEEKRLIDEDYLIEVSSPGLDRPFRTAKDYLRALGRSVRFHLLEPIDARWEYTGVVQDVLENGVLVQLSSTTKEIPFDKISKAIQVF